MFSRMVQLVAFEAGATLHYFGGDISNVVAELATVRQAFGGRLREALTGAAPIAPEILEFFNECGIPIYEAYGMTESTALISANVPGAVRFGTVAANLENDLRQSRWIAHAVMFGDRRPYAVGLITLDAEEILPWAREHGLPEEVAVLAGHPDVRALLDGQQPVRTTGTDPAVRR